MKGCFPKKRKKLFSSSKGTKKTLSSSKWSKCLVHWTMTGAFSWPMKCLIRSVCDLSCFEDVSAIQMLLPNDGRDVLKVAWCGHSGQTRMSEISLKWLGIEAIFFDKWNRIHTQTHNIPTVIQLQSIFTHWLSIALECPFGGLRSQLLTVCQRNCETKVFLSEEVAEKCAYDSNQQMCRVPFKASYKSDVILLPLESRVQKTGRRAFNGVTHSRPWE